MPDPIQAMNDAAAKNAVLMATSTQVSSSITGASTAAQTVNASNAAASETAKGTANDLRAAAKPS
jgi:hypothetical protein